MDMIHYRDRLNVTVDELAAVLPTFPTKKAALVVGTKQGAPFALKVVRPTETVWMVGRPLPVPDPAIAIGKGECFEFPRIRLADNDQRYSDVIMIKRYRKHHAEH